MKAWNPNQFRNRSLCVLCSIILVVLVLEVLTDFSLYPWDIILVIAAGVTWGVLYFLFWRCPYCGKSLPRSGDDLVVCPYCGEPLPKRFEGDGTE